MMTWFHCRTCGQSHVKDTVSKPRYPCSYCGDIGWRKRPIKHLDMFELRKRGLDKHGSYIDAKGSGDQE
jgi:hypothetical protein